MAEAWSACAWVILPSATDFCIAFIRCSWMLRKTGGCENATQKINDCDDAREDHRHEPV